MLTNLVVAVDQRSSRHPLVGWVARLATESGSFVRVLHVVEYAGRGCRVPLENPAEAERVVEEAVFDLRMNGVRSDGLVRSSLRKDVSSVIVDESVSWGYDLIVVGTGQRRGPGGRLGGGVRERVIRTSSIPILVAPVPHVPERSISSDEVEPAT